MCRSCGAIIGAGESQCGVCGGVVGGSVPQTAASDAADRETMRFARLVLSRPYKFTVVFLIVNFFIFLLMWESSGMTWSALWSFPFPVLIAYGAKVNRLISEQHEWWRLVTPIFIHVNLPHLVVNMYSLWMVGPYVEKLYGSAKFVVFWVVTGTAGVLASYLSVINSGASLGILGRFLFKTQDGPSAGASGALFGLVGVLFVFGIKFRHELPEGFKRAFGTGMLPIILINLFIGYLGRGIIDNAAHLGGLISGAALAVTVQYRRPGERTEITASWKALQIAALLFVAICFIEAAKHFKDPIPTFVAQTALPPSSKTEEFLVYSKAMNEAQETFNAALHGDSVSLDQPIQSLFAVPQLDPEADQLRARLQSLLIRAKTERTGTGVSQSDGLAQKPLPGLAEDMRVWKKDYNRWLKTTGRNY